MTQEHINEIKAILIAALGLILFASLISFVPEDLPWYTSNPNAPTQNLIRITGAYMAGAFLFVFGYSSYALVVFLSFWSWNEFTSRELKFSFLKFLSFLVLFCVVSGLLGMSGSQESILRFQRSGIVGLFLSDFMVQYLGGMGSYIVLLTLAVLSTILIGEFLVSPLFVRIFEWGRDLADNIPPGEGKLKATVLRLKPKINIGQVTIEKTKGKAINGNEKGSREEKEENREKKASLLDAFSKVAKSSTPKIRIADSAESKEEEDVLEDEPKLAGEFTLPALDLLEDPPQIPTDKIQNNLMSEAKLLEETLANFNVMARVADIERGPAITRYELEPAPGVKVQKFTTLSDDIALAMKAPAVRIVAPIPGKNRVGIEVPNSSSASVYLKEVLANQTFRSASSKLTMALGKDIAGKPMIADLDTMPHLLIAGTTGSGKTVCVNGIIMSLLFNASPDEVKFLMVDPKMVELTPYNDIPHLLSPVVTESQKAAAALNWVVVEMENRYKKLSNEGVRSIKAYNDKGRNMPYIVVVIDELADLMQVSAKTVESAITRLAQLSRAVGIHLILATQRPSVDVITGVIKANFPARISFKVASKVDSRTVLDMNGAENLLGRGDMLFIQPGDAKPTRGQCSFVKDEEIQNVINFVKDQQSPIYDDNIMKQQKSGTSGASDQKDEYYDEAVRLVIETNQASVSILQRRMRLGYTRAARLIDMMEQQGIVGPYVGSKPRDILVDREEWLLENMTEKEADGS